MKVAPQLPIPMAASACPLAFALLILCGCVTTPVVLRPGDPAPSVRFLVTFDDGPSARTGFNPTLAILDQLAYNDVQPGIRALFFVQTLHPRGGGKPLGRAIMRRIHEQGHILGVHSVSPEGHVAHHTLDDEELSVRLAAAKKLLRSITGADPLFVRPPFGAQTVRTRQAYEALGLNMLFCDLRARDGVIHVFNASPRRHGHFRRALARIRESLPDTAPGEPPHPVLVSFHDVNPYTARHMTEYLHILVDGARRAGLRLGDKPFYESPDEVTQVGLFRRVPPPEAELRIDEGGL